MTINEYEALLVHLENAGYSKEEVEDAIHTLHDEGTPVFKMHPIAAVIEITRMIDLWRWMPND